MTTLYEHNRIAYEAAVSMLARTGRAAVIHPTGTGKSFIGFKLCEDNPDKVVLWLSPSEYIFRTQLENWRAADRAADLEVLQETHFDSTSEIQNDLIRSTKNMEECEASGELSNIRFCTYARLMLMQEKELAELRPDLVVLDEFHRAGAQRWGEGLHKLLEIYPDVPVLGLSATNVRYLDGQRDMADELFDGNIASEMTLGDAIVRGILNLPKYILSTYSCQKELERYRDRVKNAKSKAVRTEAERYALECAAG